MPGTQEAAIQFVADSYAAVIPENTGPPEEIQPNIAALALIDEDDRKQISGRRTASMKPVKNTVLTKNSVPTEVDFYIPGNTKIHKFQFFYGRHLLDADGFYPVWTAFDLNIINLTGNFSPLTLIEHGWDKNKERGRLLFDSMDADFKRFATIDLQKDKRRHWFNKVLLRIFADPDLVGIWELHSRFAEYFLEGDGLGRGSFWYIYGLRRLMSPDEFIVLLMEYCYKFRKLLDDGLFDYTALQEDNIVVHPDVETFVFKDFTSARLCVSTSSPAVSQKMIALSRQAGVVIRSELGDIRLASIEHLSGRSRFLVR